MLKSVRLLSLTAAIASVLAVANPANAGFVADGNLQEWGIGALVNNTSNGAATTWWSGQGFTNGVTPNINRGGYLNLGGNGASSFNNTAGNDVEVKYALEDTNDNSNSYTVGPLAGGQDYDAEFMGVAIDEASGMMYIAIVSGQRPDNGRDKFSPGDILIRKNGSFTGVTRPDYGIEVGGGYDSTSAGDSPADLYGVNAVVDEGELGTTYGTNSSGATIASGSLNGNGKTAGSVWANIGAGDALWLTSNVAATTNSYVQLNNGGEGVNNGTKVGDAIDYHFSLNTLANPHSVIELALDYMDVFGTSNFNGWSFQWAPSCFNDETSLAVTFSGASTNVPEPTSMAMLCLAGLGGLGLRLRRKAKDGKAAA